MQLINGKEVFTTLDEIMRPEHTALLLIDLQNDYMKPGGTYHEKGEESPKPYGPIPFVYSSSFSEIIPSVKSVLDAARRLNILVVHLQMTFYPNSLAESPVEIYRQLKKLKRGNHPEDIAGKLTPYCIHGTWGWQIIDELAPKANELVVLKHRSSAFVGTNLDMLLRSNRIKSVCITGVVSTGCVLSTAIDAGFYDYYCVVLEDCVAGRSGRSPDQHVAALSIMSGRGDVSKSEKVLEIWERNAP